MRVVYKNVGYKAVIINVPNDLKRFQKMVGGNIEAIRITPNEHNLFEKTVIIICNEEGKLNGLKPNFYCEDIQDIICGAAVFVGEKGDDFSDLTLNDALTICDVTHY